MPDRRAVSPVVGKALELGLVLLVAAVLGSVLYGQVVPAYRTAAGETSADRALSTVAGEVERVPSTGDATSLTRLRLPARIAGEHYTLRATGQTLILDHPDDRLDARYRVSLPPGVVRVTGSVTSASDPVLRSSGTDAGLVVRLANATGGRATDE
ncbi:MAG: hypothetical protein ABEJ08_01795 [Halobacteriaceae archaeon]